MGVTALSVFAPLALLYLQHPESLFFTASRTSILVPGWTAGAAEALGTTSFGLVLEQTWVTVLGFSVAELQGVYFEPGVPLLFGVSAWLFMLGLVWLLLATRDSRLTPALLTIAATCIIGGLSIQAPNAQRMLLLPPMLALLVVVPLDWISVRVERLVFPIQHLMLIALSSLILIAVYENTSFFFRDYLQREEYGSLNGEVTQAMAVLLEEQGWQDEILFIGGERMSVFSIPSLPYLIPEVNASDLEPPYDLPKSMDPEQERWLIILPEMSAARARLEGACDSGATIPRYNRRGILLFHYCQLDPT
jgi:hypothetical protein